MEFFLPTLTYLFVFCLDLILLAFDAEFVASWFSKGRLNLPLWMWGIALGLFSAVIGALFLFTGSSIFALLLLGSVLLYAPIRLISLLFRAKRNAIVLTIFTACAAIVDFLAWSCTLLLGP